jgi:hypothetical protein
MVNAFVHCRDVAALCAITVLCSATPVCGQNPPSISNFSGIQLRVAAENTQPTLRVILPGHPETDRAIEIIFPEHVTARPEGAEAEHLYLFRPGKEGDPPPWRQTAQSLEYERDFKGVHFLARATLEDDGLQIHYEFTNRSKVDYRMIYAVTDPRLTSFLHDPRLERTYVHHKEGFDLLASETPERVTTPLNRWLPLRYLASFTWPVAAKRVEQRGDGLTYYNKSRAVDLPMIATLSSDRKWVVASFTRTAGNVWSNPELTCQHVDPETSLASGQTASLEVKILIFEGSLEQALQKVVEQRNTLK